MGAAVELGLASPLCRGQLAAGSAAADGGGALGS